VRRHDPRRPGCTSIDVEVQIEDGLALHEALPGGRLEGLTSASSWPDPRCSIRREPRRIEYTICTAVAPDAVLTVRT